MSDKTTKQTRGGSRGYWFTTEKGQHLFAKEGETPKEACERYYTAAKLLCEQIYSSSTSKIIQKLLHLQISESN